MELAQCWLRSQPLLQVGLRAWGFLMSLAAGVIVFFLLITSLAQLIFQLGLSMAAGGTGSQGGGGRYRGGGGGFGGGGASGSW